MPNKKSNLVLPKVIESKIIFNESLLKIRLDKLQVNQQLPYSYYTMLTRPFAVSILAITEEGSYVVINEYRHPTGHILLSLPGGFVDPQENILNAAQRELLEETGYHAQNFTLMGSAYPYAGFSSQKTHFILANHAYLADRQKLEVSEIISPILLTPEDLKTAIQNGAELDGTLGTALFFYNTFLFS